MRSSSRIFDESLTWAVSLSIETISSFSCKLIDFKRREEVSGRGSEGMESTTWGRRNACEMRRAEHNLNAGYRPDRPAKESRRRFDNRTRARSQNYRNCRSTESSTWPLPVALKGADTELRISSARLLRELSTLPWDIPPRNFAGGISNAQK